MVEQRKRRVTRVAGLRPSPSPRRRADDEASEAPEAEAPEPVFEGVSEPAPQAEEAEDSAGRPRRIPLVGVLAAICVVMTLAAGAFATLWWLERGAEAQRRELLERAETIAIDFHTYDYQNLDENFERVREHSTQRYYEQSYAGVAETLADVIIGQKVRSQAEVIDAGIAEVSDDEVIVLLAVDQTTTNASNPQPKIDRNRMVLTLVKEDGEWKLDGLALV